MRLPNHTEPVGAVRPRMSRTMPQAANRQSARTPSSAAAPGCVRSRASWSSSRMSNWRFIGRPFFGRLAVAGRSPGASRAYQHTQMRGDAAREGAEVVAALETRDDAALRVLVGDCLDALRDPGVVGLDETELAEIVVAMRIEAGRDEDHLRRERIEPLHPVRLDQLAHLGAARVRRDRNVDHVRAHGYGAAVRIQRMLEDAHHEDALVAGDDVFGAVAVVHVEVDDGDALQAAYVERVARRDADVVEEAKAHRLVARGVMAGGPHRAERVLGAAVEDRIGRGNGGAGGAHDGGPGTGPGYGVGIDRAGPAIGLHALEHFAKPV